MMKFFSRFASASALCAVPAGLGAASADAYPNRLLRFIVPFAAGGPADVIVRVLSEKLAEALGQAVNIDNRDGMNGIVGTEICAGCTGRLHDCICQCDPFHQPERPTIAESGLAGYDVSPSAGVVAPAGTPDAVVSRLSRAIAKIVHMPDVEARFRSDGKEPLGTTPQDFAAFIRTEIGKWRDVVKHAGIEVKDYGRYVKIL